MLSRQLISLDIILQELEELDLSLERTEMEALEEHDADYLQKKHKDLLKQCVGVFQQILKSSADLTEYEFKQVLEQSELNQNLGSKQLLSIHLKLLIWVLDFYSAKLNAEGISDSDLSHQAEVKLDLYHTKANKAKNQIKALAHALGAKEYKIFIKRFNLSHSILAHTLDNT